MFRSRGTPPFLMPRYISEKSAFAKNTLSASDAENISLGDVLKMESNSLSSLQNLSLGYNDSNGSAEVRRLIASTYFKINSEQVLLHAGSGESIHNFAHSIMSMGDPVIVQWPCFQSLYQCFSQRGCMIQLWTPILVEKNNTKYWEFSLDTLKSLLNSVPRVSNTSNVVVVINNPHNPTGFGFSRDQLYDLVEICKANDVYLLSDEVYKDMYFCKVNDNDLPPLAVCDIYEKGVSIGSMSKQFGMGGLRIGWVATTNQQLLSSLKTYKDYVSFSVSAPSEILAIITLRHRLSILKTNTKIITENLSKCYQFFSSHSSVFEMVPMRAGPLFITRLLPSAYDAVISVARKRGVAIAKNIPALTRSASTQSLAAKMNEPACVVDLFCELCLTMEGLLVVPMSVMRFVPQRNSRMGSSSSLNQVDSVDKNAWIQEWFRVGVGRKGFGDALVMLGKVVKEIKKEM